MLRVNSTESPSLPLPFSLASTEEFHVVHNNLLKRDHKKISFFFCVLPFQRKIQTPSIRLGENVVYT